MSNIALKKSSVSGRVPLIGDLAYGELALNYADGLLYFKNSVNQIKAFKSKGLEVSSITGTTQGTPFTEVTRLVFDEDTGFNLTELSAGVVKVALGSTFKTWKITGQSDLVAVGEDTIQIVAGTGISLTTDPNSAIKKLTISSTVSATTTEFAFQNVGFNYSVTGFDDTTYPTLTLVRGELYYFNFTNVNSTHPIALRLDSGSVSPVPGTTGNNPTSGVYGNGTTSTIVAYQVPLDAPAVIYYQCVFHSGMIGEINIIGGGSVRSTSVVSANGFAGTVATSTTTPAITITTSINGILKGNGTALLSASSGVDYAPGTSTLATGIIKSTTATGVLTIAAAGTDYQAPIGTITGLVKGNGANALTSAIAGTDYQIPIGTITGLVKGNGANALTAAIAGTDYQSAQSVSGIVKSSGTTRSAAISGVDYAPGTSTLATGIIKSITATGALTIASAGTDYQAPVSVTGILKSSGVSGNVSAAIAGTDYQTPITLTTIGSSGAASLIGNILNIPQYSGGSSGGLADAFSTLAVNGQTSLVATGQSTLQIVAGPGIIINTNNAISPKSLTLTSTLQGINLDGGRPDSVYGGSPLIDGGGVI